MKFTEYLKGEVFICVDSLNCNWFYKINRWVHYLRGERTLSAIKQMSIIETISLYRNKFRHVDVRYFGSILWVAQILKRILGEIYTSKIIDFFDQIIHVERSAFKFVMLAKKEIK